MGTMQAPEEYVHITVLLFAAFREATGENRVHMRLPAGSSLQDLFSALAENAPKLHELQGFTSFAVNREMAPPSTVLRDGDEVALLQPLSGGTA